MERRGHTDVPIACDFTAIAPAERPQHQELAIQILTALVEETRELRDGYAWRYAPNHFSLVADFVANERRCCPFFTFVIEVTRDGGPIWLRITGSSETKRYLHALCRSSRRKPL